MGSTALVGKARVDVVAEENDGKANCLNNLKCKQEKPVCYRGDFIHLVWKVI